METINNMASAAAQVVWPTSADNHNSESSNTGSNTGSAAAGEEPLSGVQGDTSKGEPYDAGNKADQDALDAAAIKDSKAPSAVQEPGPRPLADVARERGGDAGPYSSGPSSGSAVPSGPTGRDDDSDPYKPQAHSHGEGTGEQYVRSTGLHADGGDFDAANPGAGREADSKLSRRPENRKPERALTG